VSSHSPRWEVKSDELDQSVETSWTERIGLITRSNRSVGAPSITLSQRVNNSESGRGVAAANLIYHAHPLPFGRLASSGFTEQQSRRPTRVVQTSTFGLGVTSSDGMATVLDKSPCRDKFSSCLTPSVGWMPSATVSTTKLRIRSSAQVPPSSLAALVSARGSGARELSA
jgi:hypothetical protein